MTNIVWPRILLRGIAHQNLNILFGAGLGVEFGFPLWDNLIKNIFNDVEYKLTESNKKEFCSLMNSHDFLEAMEFLLDVASDEVIECMERSLQSEEFNQDSIENSNLYLLLKLKAHSYLTTNIDNSFEQVKSYTGHKTAIIYPHTSEEDIKDKLIYHDSSSNPLIIRLHGDLSMKSSLIFSKSQYDDLMNGNSYIYTQILPALFLTSATLIVGYSFSDPDLQLLLQNMNSVEGTRKNIFLLNTSKEMTDFRKNILKKRYGINIIDLTQGDFPDDENIKNKESNLLKYFLRELLKAKEYFEGLSLNEVKDIFTGSDVNINNKIFLEK